MLMLMWLCPDRLVNILYGKLRYSEDFSELNMYHVAPVFAWLCRYFRVWDRKTKETLWYGDFI